MKFDHVGVVVANIEEGQRLFTAMFGIRRWTRSLMIPGVGVCVANLGSGLMAYAIELIAPVGDDSPIYVALKTGRRHSQPYGIPGFRASEPCWQMN